MHNKENIFYQNGGEEITDIDFIKFSKNLFTLLKSHKWNDFITEINKINPDDVDINIRDNNNNYLIQYAIMYNKINIVNLLINKGCRLDITDADGRTILFIPIRYNYLDILDTLLKFNTGNIGINIIDIKDKDGNTPLHYTILYNNIEACTILLNNGADINIKDKNNNTALHLAISADNMEIINLLLNTENQKIDINSQNNMGDTALHHSTNFKFYDISKLLIENGADININNFDEQITPIFHTVKNNDVKIFELLLENKVDANYQDYLGNTIVHHIILYNYPHLFDIVLKHRKLINLTDYRKIKNENVEKSISRYSLIKFPNLIPNRLFEYFNPNIVNLFGKTCLHLLFGSDVEYNEDICNIYLQKMLMYTKLDIQDEYGNTLLHYLLEKNIWEKYIDILNKKKNFDIYIKNIENIRPVDYIQKYNKEQMDKLINIIVNSYKIQLRGAKNQWYLEWENICSNDNLSKEQEDECYKKIKNHILTGKTSFPISKKPKLLLRINADINFTTFTGVTIDVLSGILYLLDKYDNVKSILSQNFSDNEELQNYYLTLGYENNSQTEFINFEITWLFQKIFYTSNFDEIIKKVIQNHKRKNIRYIIIPIGIELSLGSHANYLIYDFVKNETERFEPYGAGFYFRFNYNPDLLDFILESKLKSLFGEDMKYFRPKDYLPKIGFQIIDSYENNKYKKIGDPGGFCALWCIWYAEMRIQHPEIERIKLVDKLINSFRYYNYSIKNTIRNYSANIINIRDQIFKKANLDINLWINENYSHEQVNIINNELKNKISKIEL
jgi:ankyrin repeat protein